MIAALFILALSLSSSSAIASLNEYESVNGGPQFSASDETFSFYWAVWRTLSPTEGAALRQANGGSILSQREIGWEVTDCATGALIHQDSERLWYIDPISFLPNGKIAPSPYAYREDYTYFVMA